MHLNCLDESPVRYVHCLLPSFKSLKCFEKIEPLASCGAVSAASQRVSVAADSSASAGLGETKQRNKRIGCFLFNKCSHLWLCRSKHILESALTYSHSNTCQLAVTFSYLDRCYIICIRQREFIHSPPQPASCCSFSICKHFRLIWIKLFNALNLLLV